MRRDEGDDRARPEADARDRGGEGRGRGGGGGIRVIALTFLAGLCLAALAFADTKTANDKREVKNNKLDIRSATAGHAGRKLKHDVVLWNQVPDRFHGQVCVDLSSRRSGSGQQTPDYGAFSICIANKRQRRVAVVQMQTQKVTGHARVRYPGGRTVRFLFRKRAIGSPQKYFWRIDTFFSSSKKRGDCPKQPHGSYSCADVAPEVGREKKHVL